MTSAPVGCSSSGAGTGDVTWLAGTGAGTGVAGVGTGAAGKGTGVGTGVGAAGVGTGAGAAATQGTQAQHTKRLFGCWQSNVLLNTQKV